MLSPPKGVHAFQALGGRAVAKDRYILPDVKVEKRKLMFSKVH
jgi:ribosomal protein L22